MSRTKLAVLIAVAGWFAAACTSDKETAPLAPSFLQTAAAPTSNDIFAKINTLFPAGGLRTAARAQFTNIVRVYGHGQVADARDKMFALVDFAFKKYYNHQLIGDQSATTQSNLRDLVVMLYQFVGLTAPNIPPGALGSDGAVAVVGPAGGLVETGTKFAGVNFPAGALPQNVVVTINRDANQTNPLQTDLNQFPLFYDFATFPVVPHFGQPAVVGVCVLDQFIPEGRGPFLRLAHNVPIPESESFTIEILPLAAVPFLDCTNASLDGGIGARRILGDFLALMLGAPRDLHAAALVMPGGLGGQTSSFSPFGAVDPGNLVFTGQPTMTTAGQPIPAVRVTVEKVNGDTIKDFIGTVTVAIGTNPSGGTLSGTTTRTVVSGTATFSDLSINQPGTGYTLTATATSAEGEPPSPATSAPFDITAPPTEIAANNFVIDLRAGRIQNASRTAGGGFYSGTQVIFGTGFAYGTGTGDVLVGYNTRNGASDFNLTTSLTVVGSEPLHTTAQLQPRVVGTGISGVTVTQESFAFSTDPDRDYVLLKYTLSSTGAPVNGVFAGFVADLDLLYSGSPFDDIATFDAGLGVTEATESNTESFPQIIGMVPITSADAALNYASYTNPSFPVAGRPIDPLNSAGYFPLLSGGLQGTDPLGPTDIRQVIGFGPFSIPTGGSQVVWFALVGGANSGAFALHVAAA